MRSKGTLAMAIMILGLGAGYCLVYLEEKGRILELRREISELRKQSRELDNEISLLAAQVAKVHSPQYVQKLIQEANLNLLSPEQCRSAYFAELRKRARLSSAQASAARRGQRKMYRKNHAERVTFNHR